MSDYDKNSCKEGQRINYTPMEVAIRWCNLAKYEAEILDKIEKNPSIPFSGIFPQWPCLRSNLEKIMDAIENRDIVYGRDGKAVELDNHVAPHRRTVRHTDLKSWMEKHYPEYKPSFLFDEIEQAVHSKITTEAYEKLRAEMDAKEVRLENAEHVYRAQKKQIAELKKSSEVPTQGHNAYRLVIKAMAEYIIDDATINKPHSMSRELFRILEGAGKVIPTCEKTLSGYLKEK
jgi:hypothetical protein